MYQTNTRRACRGIVLFINHAISCDVLSSVGVEGLLILFFVNNNMSPPNRTNRDNHIC